MGMREDDRGGMQSMDMRMERRVPTPMRSVRRFGVRSELVYFSRRGMGYRQPPSSCAYSLGLTSLGIPLGSGVL